MSKVLDFRNPTYRASVSFLPEDRQLRRVLFLAFAFFLSGLAFFALRITASQEAMATPITVVQESQPVSPDPHSKLAHFPDPSTFITFQFHTGMQRYAATSTCEDQFAVMMLYASGKDYRADPQSALYNVATPCIKSTVVPTDIQLSSLHLIEGNRYYIVRAQQGNDTWYNPY